MITARNERCGAKSLRRIEFLCPHGRKRTSASTGKRWKPTAYVGCPVRVNVNQQQDGAFVVTRAELNHVNHDISREMFEKYAVNKRLSKDQEDAVRAFLETAPSAVEVASLLKDITGKDYSIQDAANISKRLKRTNEGIDNEHNIK